HRLQLTNLPYGGGDVTSVGVGHALHRDGRIAANQNRADADLAGLSSFHRGFVMHVYRLLAQAQACHTRLTVGIELHRLALVFNGRYRIRCAYDQIQRTGLIDVESLPGTHLPAVQDAATGDADLYPAVGRESD